MWKSGECLELKVKVFFFVLVIIGIFICGKKSSQDEFKHPDLPDNSNSGLTNGVSLRRGCLFNQPMAEEGSVLETCLTKIILFSISLHILYMLAVKVQLIFEQMW